MMGSCIGGVSIIHGVALGKNEFDKMAKNEMGLIWSPRSNIELYGAITDVRSAKAAGVRIALAPDWSPSGSDGVIEELKYAATWNAAQPSPTDPTKFGLFTDKELVQMATVTPALLAAVDQEIGSLAPGHYADLLLIRKNGSDPYQALIHASPADVRLVIINGVPLYGDADLMEKLSPRRAIEIISICGRQKALYMDPQSGIPETLKSFKQISQELETALSHWGGSVSPLAICDGTNLH
jgi:5-methylthioadenosine/S-adenosylhomocysteine deaminase